jgi:hypothetical protein
MWRLWHTFSLLLIITTMGALGLNPIDGLNPFLANLLLMALFTTIAGHGVIGLWRGLLIDERNKLSLSRLQMVLWMIVVLSGFLGAALSNIAHHEPDPLKIKVPKELWILLGISTTSLVGSPLIRSTKTAEAVGTGAVQPETQKKVEKLMEDLARQKVPPEAVDTNGKIVIWRWPQDARLADLFQGDEIANAASLDLGKVQMFFFTCIGLYLRCCARQDVCGGRSNTRTSASGRQHGGAIGY